MSAPLTRNQPVKAGKSFVLNDTKDAAKVWEYFLYISDVCRNLTTPVDYGKGVQGLDPLIYDYYKAGNTKGEKRVWAPKDSFNLMHYPLIAVGDVDANLSFCRVSVQAQDWETLYVSFRPFLLEDLQAMVYGESQSRVSQAKSVFSALSRFWWRDSVTANKVQTEKKVIENLLYLMGVVSNGQAVLHPTGDGGMVEIGKGYTELLTQIRTKVRLENDFMDLAKDSNKFSVAAQEFLQLQHLNSVGQNTYSPSVIGTLVAFFQAWKPKQIVFTGFSLGGGSSTAAACLCHLQMASMQTTLPKFHVASLAGTMVGGPLLRSYVQRNFKTCVTVRVRGTLNGLLMEDPVSQMPFSSKFVHVGEIFIVDYDRKTLLPSDVQANIDGTNMAVPSWALMLSQVKIDYVTTALMASLGEKDRRVADAFGKIHMTGEDMISRVAALELLRHNIKSPLLNTISCDWFTGTGTAAKYKVCFEEKGLCSLEEVEDAMTKRTKGGSRTAAPRRACVRTSAPAVNTNNAPRRKVKVKRR